MVATLSLKTAPPSEQAVAKAAETVTIQDAKGRSIVLRKPGVLAQYRLIEAIGAQAAENTVYVSMVLPLIYIASIDDDLLTMPVNKLQIDGLITRLDEDGIAAVMHGVQEHFGSSDPAADKAAIKK
jgi:hypothetical protein